jgi:hypothetical protein
VIQINMACAVHHKGDTNQCSKFNHHNGDTNQSMKFNLQNFLVWWGCCIANWGRMVVKFTTTYAISTYHHKSCEFESHWWQGVLDTTLCDKVYDPNWQCNNPIKPKNFKLRAKTIQMNLEIETKSVHHKRYRILWNTMEQWL